MSERALWCAVIDQAVTDAFHRPILRHTPLWAKKSAARELARQLPQKWKFCSDIKQVNELARKKIFASLARERNKARDWLTGDSNDFREVCYLANMEPDAILKRMKEFASRNWALDKPTERRIKQFQKRD